MYVKFSYLDITVSWEQRKLGDEIKTLPFKEYIAECKVDGIYPIIQQGDTPVCGYGDAQPFQKYESVVLFGDHTLSLYAPQKPFLIATDGVKIITSEKNNSKFLLYFIERYKPKSEGYKRYYSILVERTCQKPSDLSEQQKIGAFFKVLDSLITLHQREY